MSSNHGISYDALKYALTIKESYQSGELADSDRGGEATTSFDAGTFAEQ